MQYLPELLEPAYGIGVRTTVQDGTVVLTFSLRDVDVAVPQEVP